MQSVETGSLTPLQRAREKLYEIAGGSIDSGDVRAARLTTEQRLAYFRSPEFRDWVASENAAGKQVFWLKDVDKTQGEGDIFTFFFQWRALNDKFTPAQLKTIERFLMSRRSLLGRAGVHTVRAFYCGLGLLGKGRELPSFAKTTPSNVVNLWRLHERGHQGGISLYEFWSKIYWPTQFGLTEQEKLDQVREFAPLYAEKVYPGVVEENRILEEAGVHVVIVSNGDQELAIAAAPFMGIKPENVVGSHLLYKDGRATGSNHSYEVFDPAWDAKPQPGKPMSFHYWIYANRARWGWKNVDSRYFVIAGRDGDSAAADGGMMVHLPPPEIGNFMIDTPGEPDRILKFYRLMERYGWTPGQCFTLIQRPTLSGTTGQ